MYSSYSEDFLVVDISFDESSLVYMRNGWFRERSVLEIIKGDGNGGNQDEEDNENGDELAISS